MLLEILAPANLVTPGQSQEKSSLVPGNYFWVIFGSEYLAPEIGHFWQYLTFSDKNNNKEFNLFSYSILDSMERSFGNIPERFRVLPF